MAAAAASRGLRWAARPPWQRLRKDSGRKRSLRSRRSRRAAQQTCRPAPAHPIGDASVGKPGTLRAGCGAAIVGATALAPLGAQLAGSACP